MPLVSVIVPAFNAERTIDRTLLSVRSQTHRELEIIVVDDGSFDATAQHVLAQAAEDSRIRLVTQPNNGVAAARNRGIAESCADYVAPIDADDLWHPEKIARQLAAMDGHDEVGLVATAYCVIDEHDRVVAEIGGRPPRRTGFKDLCRRNFIGNGSSALMRRSMVQQVGGYDRTLRARGGQGCEDLKLYLQLAEGSKISFLTDPLTAYRRGPANMSGDTAQMLRSFDMVADEFCGRRPELRQCFNAHRVHMLCWLINGTLRSGSYAHAARLGGHLISTPSLALPHALAGAAKRRLKVASGRATGKTARRRKLGWVHPVGRSGVSNA
ncbi:glycosyltransferase family 2 protein [Sphingomonas sp. BN140010]|uniref:Glycosyltransferase family 2 protein n=1 Tax=Sphingomonas arvum TaxID=2992113 RepID=A0ABT3JE64_9SPHN|nr:glycosyltransferase family A protein [Sphingomonas sp. BN140010]MCW3797367.1 glycosyltransferase family 2 protein [Sphingomonas sp. BN140010]